MLTIEIRSYRLYVSRLMRRNSSASLRTLFGIAQQMASVCRSKPCLIALDNL
jgi:hypothetical protein